MLSILAAESQRSHIDVVVLDENFDYAHVACGRGQMHCLAADFAVPVLGHCVLQLWVVDKLD